MHLWGRLWGADSRGFNTSQRGQVVVMLVASRCCKQNVEHRPQLCAKRTSHTTGANDSQLVYVYMIAPSPVVYFCCAVFADCTSICEIRPAKRSLTVTSLPRSRTSSIIFGKLRKCDKSEVSVFQKSLGAKIHGLALSAWPH